MKYLILNIIAAISIIATVIFWGTILSLILFGGKVNDYEIRGILEIVRKWF